jgi:protein-S-isoprenylcysteine O-methyltransferase Ste14
MELVPGIGPVASAETATARTARAERGLPAIIAPGPWIAFGALALGLLFDRLHKFGALAQAPSWLRNILALVLIAYGGWMIFRANVVVRRTGAAFQPWRPTSAIAAVGIYARTRNPMYQGFLLVALGLAVVFRMDWSVLFLMPAAMLIHYGVVLREESYLTRHFGENYSAYMAQVPRYGWPLIGQRRSNP